MPSSSDRLDEIREAYAHLQSWRAVSRELGIPRSTVRHYQRQIKVLPRPMAGGSVDGLKEKRRALPRKGSVKRYICTSAQNNTHVHEGVWNNLLALAAHYDAEILVSRFAYNKDAYSQPVKPGTKGTQDDGLWYDDCLKPYVNDERIELAPGIVWCGEMNILPTAVRPLTGLHSYTGRKSTIIPHVKIAMESVPSSKDEDVKLMFTTGTVTLRNYIQKKAGLKAEFHHCFGALLVEVDSRGRWFCRQLNAANDNSICDLDVLVMDGGVTTGHSVEAINWGDIHTAQVDETVAAVGWGTKSSSMMASLKPRVVVLHDLVDFRARNHHDIRNPHEMFQRYTEGEDGVEEELAKSVALLAQMQAHGAHVVVVDSNHDNALGRWLRESDYRTDPRNAVFFLRAQLAKYESIRDRNQDFHLIEWALQGLGCSPDIQFLREDESYVICKEQGGGIECGHHGHLGPNGVKGTPSGLAKTARRANTGHSHTTCILDGLYVAGASCKLEQNYNKGPSSWTHSHILTYQNGKRAIVTMYDGVWRAEA